MLLAIIQTLLLLPFTFLPTSYRDPVIIHALDLQSIWLNTWLESLCLSPLLDSFPGICQTTQRPPFIRCGDFFDALVDARLLNDVVATNVLGLRNRFHLLKELDYAMMSVTYNEQIPEDVRLAITAMTQHTLQLELAAHVLEGQAELALQG